MKAYKGTRGIAPLNLGTRWLKRVSLMPGCFTLWERIPHQPLNIRLGEPQSQSGHAGEKINLLSLLGFKLWIIQHIAQSLS